MQILEIVLYPRKNLKKRIIDFKTGKVNIILGDGSTGKSAVGDIIEYCLGREKCTVPDGYIRDTVSWYGLLIQLSDTRIFIARKNPELGYSTSNQAYFEYGEDLKSPDDIPNGHTNIETVIESITKILGISPNLNISISSQMKWPITISSKHSLYYCFQQQGEIALKDSLFHRQHEDMIKQTIKVTLPYFLGSIPEKLANYEFELLRTRRELFRLEQELKEFESIKVEGKTKAENLLARARSLGLLTENDKAESSESYKSLLKKALLYKPKSIMFPNENELLQLQKETQMLQSELNRINEIILQAKESENEITGYANELDHQKLRLESIGLFNSTKSHNTCPLCSNITSESNSNVNVIIKSLEYLQQSLKTALKEQPKIQKHLEELILKRDDLNAQINKKISIITDLLKQKESFDDVTNAELQIGQLLGQIEFWIDSVDLTERKSPLMLDIEEKKNKIKELEDKLDEGKQKEKLNSILEEIGDQIRIWAKQLNLDQSEFPILLDLNELTLTFKKEYGNITLANVGASQNWMPYHVLTYLALQQYFIKKSRPVPRFIFLDTPSQAYFPEVRENKQKERRKLSDSQLDLLLKFYNVFFKICEQLSPNLQIIISEHADLPNSHFQSFVRYTWQSNEKLIPETWYS